MLYESFRYLYSVFIIYYVSVFLKNKTFKIEWTNVAYDVYTMGQLRATNSSQTAVIYGALTQE